MTYLNFTKITPAAPNDPAVDEVAQLNNNWDAMDQKLQPYLIGGAISGLQAGQEFFDSNWRYAVWDGTTGRIPDDIDAGWSAWTALPILAPRVARPSFTPRWRVNTAYRMVELSGCVQFDAASSAWTLGSYLVITNDVAGGIPATFTPIGGTHIGTCAATVTTSAIAGAQAFIDKPGLNTFCRVRVQYMGGAGGSNFVSLDHLWWWY